MNTEEFLAQMNRGEVAIGGSETMACMHRLAQEALQITAELNATYHTPEEIQDIFATLTGKPVNRTFSMFPPFYTDCGKNITIGNNVFINSGCRFQDQGGIFIGDNALIGHNVVFATLNHGAKPNKRADLFPAPIVLEKNVWIGANATILQGVTIGENAIVAAGAVVCENVAPNTIVGGIPAKFIKDVPQDDE